MKWKELVEKVTRGNTKEQKPKDFAWESFQEVAKEQFIRLRDKGLSIPVITL
jgi:hypothetical protein